MKKFLSFLMVGLLAVGVGGTIASAAAFDWHIPYQDEFNAPQTADITPPTDRSALLVYNINTGEPEFYTVNETTLGFDNINRNLAIGSLEIGNVNGLETELDDLDTRIDDAEFLIDDLSLVFNSHANELANVNLRTFTLEDTRNKFLDALAGTSTLYTLDNASNTYGLLARADKIKYDGFATPSTSVQTRSIVTGTGATGFQVSSTREADVNYSSTIVTTATIGGNQSGTLVLEIAPTNSATAGDWVEIGRCTNGQAISLALTLQSVQTIGCQIGGHIPAGYFAKIRSINNAGTPSFTYNSGQEILR